MALKRLLGADAIWIKTYPETRREWMCYRLDRQGWMQRAAALVNAYPRDAALFINLPRFVDALEPRPGNLLWLTDDADLHGSSPGRFERVFVSDPGYAESVRQAVGTDRFAGTVPFALEPSMHLPCRRSPSRDVCFIGNRDPKRDAHLESLLVSGYRCTIVGNYFGRSWIFARRPGSFRSRVPPDEMGAIYARHAVGLNVHAQVVRQGTNMRTFECAGYGIPQLVEHRPGLDALFSPGDEIYTYQSPDELTSQLERVMGDQRTARDMAGRARRRAQAHHTYDHRVQQMLATLG